MSLFDLFDDEEQPPPADQGWDFGGIPKATTPAPAPASAPPSDGWDFGGIPQVGPRRPTYASMADQLQAKPSTPIAGTLSGGDVSAPPPLPAAPNPDETTTLPPPYERAFQQWAQASGITDVDHPDSHYDYRGLFLAVKGQPIPVSADRHFPDTFKQHGHPTFSIESQYSHGPDDGGRWLGDQFVAPGTTAPGQPPIVTADGAIQLPPNAADYLARPGESTDEESALARNVVSRVAHAPSAALGLVEGNLTNIPSAVGEQLAGQNLPGHEGETTLASRLANHARMILGGRGGAVAPLSIPGALINPPDSAVGPQTIITADGAAQLPTQVRSRAEMVALETGRRGLDMAAKLITDPTAIAAMGVPGKAGELLANAFLVEGVTSAVEVAADPKSTPEDVAEAVVGATINAVPAAARIIRPKAEALMQRARQRAAERVAFERAHGQGFENARPAGEGYSPRADRPGQSPIRPSSQGPPLAQEPPPVTPVAARPGASEGVEPVTSPPVPSPGVSPAAPATPYDFTGIPTVEATPVRQPLPESAPVGNTAVTDTEPTRVLSDVPDLAGGTLMTGERVRDLLGVEPKDAVARGWVRYEEHPEQGVAGYRLTQNRPDLGGAAAAPAIPSAPGSTPVHTGANPQPERPRTADEEADDILRELEAEQSGKLHQESADSPIEQVLAAQKPEWHPESPYTQTGEDNDPAEVLRMVAEEQVGRLHGIAQDTEALGRLKPGSARHTKLKDAIARNRDEYEGVWDETAGHMTGVDVEAVRAAVERAAGGPDAVSKPGTTPVDVRQPSGNGEGVGSRNAGGREAAGTREAETAGGANPDHAPAQAGSLNAQLEHLLTGARQYKPMLPDGTSSEKFQKFKTPFSMQGVTVTAIHDRGPGEYDVHYTRNGDAWRMGLRSSATKLHQENAVSAHERAAAEAGLAVGDRVTRKGSPHLGEIREFVDTKKRGPRAFIRFTDRVGEVYEMFVDLKDVTKAGSTPVTPAAAPGRVSPNNPDLRIPDDVEITGDLTKLV
jgi:hypothetical protein